MERLASSIDETADSILLGLGRVISFELLGPARHLARGTLVVETGTNDRGEIDPSTRDPHRAGIGIQMVKDAFQSFGLRLRDQVALVDDDHIGELDLVRQEIDDRPFVLVAHAHSTIGEVLLAVEVPEEVRGVHHGHHRVDRGDVVETPSVFVPERERRGHRHGFADAGRLDQEVVESALRCEAIDLDHQVFAEGAADAAVGHLDHSLVRPGQFGATVTHQGRVDVHFGHVVDDDRDPQPFAVVQDVVEQRRLAGTEEAGEHGDGKMAFRFVRHSIVPQIMRSRGCPGTTSIVRTCSGIRDGGS